MTQIELLKKEIEELKKDIKAKKEVFSADCKQNKQETLKDVFAGLKYTEYGINSIKFLTLYDREKNPSLGFMITFEDESSESFFVDNPIFR